MKLTTNYLTDIVEHQSTTFTWKTIVTGGTLQLQLLDRGRFYQSLILTTAEAAALGSALGGSGGAASSTTGP